MGTSLITNLLMISYTCQYKGCLEDTGFSIVCPLHRKFLKGQARRRMDALFQEIGKSRKYMQGIRDCEHCGEPYPNDKLAIDHHPYTKGARPDLRYDVRNMKLSCAGCNDSNNRPAPTQEDFEPFLP